ncbi:hypothetical protein ACTWPB_16630 [Nocardia sp. IBHARD005]|uniref:hypothetical protein n=1 Tax=Nocardia sp. IBHARD005 TaxID=3457765 RepID=UPI00405A411E
MPAASSPSTPSVCLRRGLRRTRHPTAWIRSPFTPGDLPEYAGRLFDYCRRNPEVIRLATWHRLERGDPAFAAPARDAELDALAAAQKEDGIGSGFSPTTLLTLVLSIALAWNPSNVTSIPASSSEAESADDRRRAIVEAVRRLL